MPIRTVSTPKPKKEYMNNSKIAQYISSNSDLLSKTMQLTTIPKKNIFVTVDLNTDKKLSVSDSDITRYDMAVMDAVYTIMCSGSKAFTPEMVVRVMSGNFDKHQHLSSQKIGAVTRSIRKLSTIRITIDSTEEFKARSKIKLKPGQRIQLTSYLMPVREAEIRSANNKTVMKGYELIEKPVLYTYAESVKQIISVPTELLQSGSEQISDTDDVVVIKRELIRRIEVMKNNRNSMNNSTIRYEWMDSSTGEKKGFFKILGYSETDYATPVQWRKKKSSLHNIIQAILADFQKEAYIKGYKILKEGTQKITGMEIILK